MKNKPTIKEIIKANLKYAISVLCSIFAMIMSFVWRDILGFVLISSVLVIAIILSIG